MAPRQFRRFDAAALFAALDAERQRRGLSWGDLEAEIGVAATTMKRMRLGGRLELDGVMFILQWLDAPAEEFLRPAPS
jgi:hypothetical protein